MSGDGQVGDAMVGDWRPRDTTPAENAQVVLMAVGAAAAAGAVTFWLARTLLGREWIEIEPPARRELGSGTPDAPRIESGSS